MKLKPIKDKKKIATIFEKGRVINGRSISVRVFRFEGEEPGYVISVPKKNFPLAVNRNLLKRRIRASMARLIMPLNDVSFFLIYISKKTLSVSAIIEECEKLFSKV
ncbi:MAG: ribonuclease P protein component [Cryomorphaceae bacterium]|nr:MAG: ribonuclease P protein component [Cryomorphaceae bacterium]